MINRDLLMEFLADIQPNKLCDDCLSDQLNIKPRQQVNQLCHRLAEQQRLQRQIAICDSCGKTKKVNSLNPSGSSDSISPKTKEESAIYNPAPGTLEAVDIEKIRTDVVQICHKVWKNYKSEAPPYSISALINSLKEDKFIPAHQANIMLTLCGLRNVFVYEGMPINKREASIALNAWGIVSDWWDGIAKKTQVRGR